MTEELLLRLQEQDAFHKVLLIRMTIEAKSGQFIQSKSLLEQYMTVNPLYSSSRDCKFIQSLITAFNEKQRDVFKASLFRHDTITIIPAWQKQLLQSIMANLS